MIYLKISQNGKELDDVVLDKEFVTFGKSADNDVHIESSGVEEKHAQIDLKKLIIDDLGTELGTLVNGNKVKSSPLDNGDEIEIGQFKIKFFHSNSAQSGNDDTTWKLTTKIPPKPAEAIPDWKIPKTIKI